jgi:hypothetical protein
MTRYCCMAHNVGEFVTNACSTGMRHVHMGNIRAFLITDIMLSRTRKQTSIRTSSHSCVMKEYQKLSSGDND